MLTEHFTLLQPLESFLKTSLIFECFNKDKRKSHEDINCYKAYNNFQNVYRQFSPILYSNI